MEFCSLTCRFASWPEEEGLDGSGSCRTFQALYCRKKGRVVHKNAPCPDWERRPPTDGPKGSRIPDSG